MDKILPRREARENAFLLAFSQTFGDIALEEALDNHAECDEEHPVDVPAASQPGQALPTGRSRSGQQTAAPPP